MGQRLRGAQLCLWIVHSPHGKRFSCMPAVFRDTHRRADQDLHFLKKFIYFLAALGLHCSLELFPVATSGGYSLVVVCTLIVVASLVAEHRLLERKLSSCGTRP